MPTSLPIMLPILPLDGKRTIPAEERSVWMDELVRTLRSSLGLPSGGWNAELVEALSQFQVRHELPDRQEQVIQAVIGVSVVGCATYRALGIHAMGVTYASPLLTPAEQTNIVLAIQYGLLDLRCQKTFLDLVWQYVPYASLAYLSMDVTRTILGWLSGRQEER